ncbi:MAG: phosphoribosylglycinamide formyltransferase [Candidatus Alcyoniella australis]|nr:phosphoribosylglycinamide formyltransferase [Candidatus Alcyoniella australis]
MSDKLKIAVLVSGSGTNFEAIASRAQGGQIDVEVCCVVSNRPGVGALERAERLGVPAHVVSHRDYPDRSSHERAIIETISPYGVDLIVLAGYTRIVTETLINALAGNRLGLPGIVNIHPADTRAYQGGHGYEFAMGLLPEHPQQLERTMITVHFVDNGVDTGPIIAQREVPVFAIDTLDDLRARGLQVEYGLYSQVLQWIAQGRVKYADNKATID